MEEELINYAGIDGLTKNTGARIFINILIERFTTEYWPLIRI